MRVRRIPLLPLTPSRGGRTIQIVKLVARLRQAGIGAILALGDKSLKSQLKQANSLGLAQAVIIGEDEIRRGRVVLRDMTKGEQVEVPLEDVVERLKKGV